MRSPPAALSISALATSTAPLWHARRRPPRYIACLRRRSDDGGSSESTSGEGKLVARRDPHGHVRGYCLLDIGRRQIWYSQA
ncbi:hypothetical protein SORBI_3001G172100 [Sorghum bicolor]|uniref:Uncharacterized protein n=1 Tax=Sorghum bicolor TaxID=4558 RepID=A0A1B6QJG4_SORBI|nr:hypothetical protein SORBI_3001G172100 [Sorghum bicolor]